MSFRKRNIVVSSPGSPLPLFGNTDKNQSPGIRPSPLDGRPTTSTGTRSLDALLAGHAGLALGTSLLIEESGSTDFGGILLRYFAAEGIVQGHHVHLLGMNEAWGKDLPGLTRAKEFTSNLCDEHDTASRMKIAWRYERLREPGRDRALIPPSTAAAATASSQTAFCHDFDLSKRLTLPSPPLFNYVSQTPGALSRFDGIQNSNSPFMVFIGSVISELSKAPKSSIHRVVIPGLLSPAVYANVAALPEHFLQFLHSLRALLRKYPTQLTALITLPLSLHPRGTGLTQWAEILSDGVMELVPFQQTPGNFSQASSGLVTGLDEMPQGMLKFHRKPVLNERSNGGSESDGLDDDLAFSLSRRKGLLIKPFNLPPVDGDINLQRLAKEGESGKDLVHDIEF